MDTKKNTIQKVNGRGRLAKSSADIWKLHIILNFISSSQYLLSYKHTYVYLLVNFQSIFLDMIDNAMMMRLRET